MVHTCLIANYGGMMAILTDQPYCLMYPMVYDDAKDKTHFNTMGSPSGQHTEACVCNSLLHLINMDPANRQKLKGSHLLFPNGMQYKTLLPIIAGPYNCHRLLMDLNTGEHYPMEVAGNFCIRMPSSLAAHGTAWCSITMNLLSSRIMDSTSDLQGESSRVYQQLKVSPASLLQEEFTEASSQR